MGMPVAVTSPTEEQAYADAFAATLVDDENGFGVEPDESAVHGRGRDGRARRGALRGGRA